VGHPLDADWLGRQTAGMTSNPTNGAEPAPSSEANSHPIPEPSVPPITLVLCGACVVLFVGIASAGGPTTWDSLARWGYLPPQRIWDGAHWGLVSSTFVHLEPSHLALNVYWLWVLGGPVERTLGPLRYLGLVLASAIVGSSLQLAASGDTGHG